MTRAFATNIAIAVSLLAMILLMASGSASSSAIALNVSKLSGTRTSWEVDVDLDGSNDGAIMMDSFSLPGGNASAARCSIEFQSAKYGDYSVNNVDPSFESLRLVIGDAIDGERIYYQVYVGVVRKAVERYATVNGTLLSVYYDADIGLLLRANYTCPNGTVANYILVTGTDAFFSYTTGYPYVLFFAISFSIAAVVFISAATIRDRKIRSKEACFSDECWR